MGKTNGRVKANKALHSERLLAALAVSGERNVANKANHLPAFVLVVGAGSTGLEVQVHIEVRVAISFGLEIFASMFGAVLTAMEVIMENSFAIATQVMACVWCGIAFLRSLW